jgi:superfamily II DNA or RNA helicase
MAAKEFLHDDNRRLIVVVPSRGLRRQWRAAAKKNFGIELQAEQFSGAWKPGYRGIVVTYAYVAKQFTLLHRLCSQHPCLVILDEIHHAGKNAAWGQGVNQAFISALHRLAMTGTPFKSDGQRIEFLRVAKDGTYHIDFKYDYPQALRDEVVRVIDFHRYDGTIGSGTHAKSTKDELNPDDESLVLRSLVLGEEYYRGMLRLANEKLTAIRVRHPNAGGLALAVDTKHAEKLCRCLQQITGEQPGLVVSDEEAANDTIEAYAKSGKRWIVSIRMVSEGVDIPRLRVLAYLTNTATELFFRQAVGRIMRRLAKDDARDLRKPDLDAYCLFPNVTTLSGYALTIEKWQQQIQQEREEKKRREREEGDRIDPRIFDASEPEFGGRISRGIEQDIEHAEAVMGLSDRYAVEESVVESLLRDYDAKNFARPAADNNEEPQEEREKRLRAKANSRAYAVAQQRGVDARVVHLEWPKQSGMSIADLERKISALERELWG